MRLLFLFALLLNLVLFAWMHYRQPVQPESPPAMDKGIDALVLLREHDSVVETGPKKPKTLSERRAETPTQSQDSRQDKQMDPATQPVVSSVACYTAGPFVTVREAADIADKLRPLGVEARQRVTETTELSAYWVYLPPFKSREHAQEIARGLERRGVTDYFVISAADKENAVSLGVFSTREAAERRRNELAKLGYAPAVDERYRVRFEYWLDYSLGRSSPSSDAVIAALAQVQSDVRVSQRSCEPE